MSEIVGVSRTEIEDLYAFDAARGTFSARDTSTVKDLVSAVVTGALKISPNPNASTPIGRLIEWLTFFVANSLKLNVQNANQLVISAAAGQQLDAMALWFGMERKPAAATTVQATLRGAPDTAIPAGVRARTESGGVFVLSEPVVLDSETGEAIGEFVCIEAGPVPCFAGELSTIDTAYGGWASVVNESDAVVGRDVETDDALRARIQESRFSSPGFLGSIKNALESIASVNSAMVVENSTGDIQTVHGIDEMAPHSIFVCVDCPQSGETNKAVAEAILNTKPPGTAYHRLTSSEGGATVQDPSETYVAALDPFGNAYPVWFYRPESVSVNVGLTVKLRNYTGTNLHGDIKAAIASWALEKNFRIGETVYAADLARAVETALSGQVFVLSSGVNDGGLAASDALPFLDIAANQKAVFPLVSESEWLTVSVV